MSLKRNLKTYLIAAVLLLLGGLAVGTVATASQPDSYLILHKKWEGTLTKDSTELEDKFVWVEILYYDLDGNGNRTGEQQTEIRRISKSGTDEGEWTDKWDIDRPIDIVEVREMGTGELDWYDNPIEGLEEIGDHILVSTEYDWDDHIQASNVVKVIGGQSSLITLEKDEADFKDGVDKYSYTVHGPNGGTKQVELTKEKRKVIVNVDADEFKSSGENAGGTYTITAAGGGTVTLMVSDDVNIDGVVAAGEGFYAEEGSTITITPTDAEEGKTYHYSVTSDDEAIATDEISSAGAEVKIEKSGTYKVKLTTSKEDSDLQKNADAPEKDEKDGSDNDKSAEEENKDAPLPDDTSVDGKDPAEEAGTTNGDNKQNDVTSEGGNTPVGDGAGDTSGGDNVKLSDEPAPLTNVLPEDGPEEDEKDGSDENKPSGNTGETQGDDGEKPVDPETSKDPDTITNDGGNEPAETPAALDAPEADENPVVATPTAEESVEVETTAFTVAYKYRKKLDGESIKNIKKTRSSMEITATIAANEGTGAPAAGWVYTLTGEGVEAQTITLNAGGEGTELTSLMAEGVLYSLSYEGGCKVSYGNLDVTITNVYKPKGAYNIVHEYYVNEISPENFEGRSSITIKNDAVGNEMTAEKLLAKNIVEPELTFTPTEGPSKGNTNTYKYTYQSDQNAYGTGSRDGEIGSVSGNNVNADEGIAPASATRVENGDNKGLEGTDWKPVNNYEEEAGKVNAVVKKDGDEIIILKYVRTTKPDDPKDPPKDPDDPKDPETPPDLPDPNDPDSPPTVTITDDDVPRTYVRVWDPKKEEWVYLPEDEVPLAGRTSPTTADGMAPVFWMFMTGLSVAGVGAFRYSKKKKEE